ncbi:MAG: hypothetical protein R3E88_18395 [Myxococcota bacterium]
MSPASAAVPAVPAAPRRPRTRARAAASAAPAALLALAVASSFGAGCYEEQPTEIVQSESPARRAPRLFEEPPPVERVPDGAPPSALAGPFHSLATLDEVVAQVADLPHEIVFDHEVPARGTCPGSRSKTLRVGRFEHLGYAGRVKLLFYDDMLWSTRFGPKDLDGYIAAVQREYGIDISNLKRAPVDVSTLVWVPPVPPLEVTFEDTRVSHELDTVEKACRHQYQLEKGLLEAAPEGSD